ncbi:MAG: septum formation protein Maf [Myxococcales bacterium]|nr:septum formation protein Maf [Myxococcales bacterium]USN51114.1 MAG: septum formation protein Maf [Myxococcales bacterium]
MKLLLASASPRRKELLCGIGYDVWCVSPDVQELDESSQESPEDIAKINAERKAKKVYAQVGEQKWDILIAADTVVSLGNRIFGKPADKEDARSMLKQLSGQTHQVSTGYALVNRVGKIKIDVVKSLVSFRSLSSNEILSYLATAECFDKSGSYAVQGAGAALIKTISGSISNIVGLPIEEVLQHARDLYNDAKK